jgi:hypothetical protein
MLRTVNLSQSNLKAPTSMSRTLPSESSTAPLHPQTELECLIRATLGIYLFGGGATPEEIANTVPASLDEQYADMTVSTTTGKVSLRHGPQVAHQEGYIIRQFTLNYQKVNEPPPAAPKVTVTSTRSTRARKTTEKAGPPVHYITTASECTRLMSGYNQQLSTGKLKPIVYVDSEYTNPKSTGGIDVIQFCFSNLDVAVVDLSLFIEGRQFPPELTILLESDDIVKMGSFFTQVDCVRLLGSYGIVVANATNLHTTIEELSGEKLATTKGTRNFEGLYKAYVTQGPALVKAKKTARSDWSKKLSKSQLSYAAIDVSGAKLIHEAAIARHKKKAKPMPPCVLEGEMGEKAQAVAALFNSLSVV